MHPGYLVRSLLAASAIDLACCNVSPPHLSRGNPKDLLSCSVSFIPSSPWYLVELLACAPDSVCPRRIASKCPTLLGAFDELFVTTLALAVASPLLGAHVEVFANAWCQSMTAMPS